jgi:two-component system sensor histidine kinase HydH
MTAVVCFDCGHHLLARAARHAERAVAMSKKEPAKTDVGQEGLSFANALRDLSVCGVILIDGQNKITTLTEEARQILDLNEEQTSRATLEALPAPLRKIVRETLSSGRRVAGRQVDLKTSGRGVVTVRVSAIPAQPGREGSGVVVVVNDLTCAKRLEQNLCWIDRLANIGTLSASMAHEIKNALVAGKTFIDLLLEKHQDAELVEVVRREMGRIDAIVSRMLKFAGPARPTFGEVGLHEVLERSLRLVQPQLEGKLIALSRSFQAAPDRVNGDECQLQQAFVNLFLNALEALGPSGTLTVATEIISPGDGRARPGDAAAPSQLRITIQDNGTGIPPENMGRLFEPFFTTKPNGTGLGLPITRRIIREHGGDLSVQSQPGKGATFLIVLPTLGMSS